MPKRLEQKLKREAKKRGFTRARTNAYVYGTLKKLGLSRRSRRKPL
jgi:hypothetical protein